MGNKMSRVDGASSSRCDEVESAQEMHKCEGAPARDAHILTWRSVGGKEVIWPQKWLSEDFPQARIISVSYDCSSKQTDTEGRMELYLIGENLVQEIMMAREHAYDRPVILVGHGFGGVVLKRLCVHAQEKKEFGAESARLHEAFSKMWRARYRWIIYGLGGYESTLQRHGHLVREASTRFGDNYITVPEDHVSVCRPSGKSDNRYLHLHNLIEDIQRQVELEKKPPVMVPKMTVGVDSLLTEILGKHIRDHKFVGIFGMGGVGKTNLAKLIFNRIFAKFEFSCFVEEIKNISGTRDDVKKRVWEKMYRHGVPVCSPSGSSGAGNWHQVMGRSLFVVFDDVEDTEDHVTLLKEIAHNGNEESRFILTSRNRNCLRDCGHICSLDTLEDEDANKLFMTYAFPDQKEPPEPFRPVLEEVVAGCEGLPLTLEVLGKYLKNIEEIDQWEEIPTALRKCDKIGNLQERVCAKLQLSYDRLEDEEKYIFLDIASFFVFSGCGFSVEDAISAWTSIYHSGRNRLRTLEDRALVRILLRKDWGIDTREFYMHEHLRNMGQRIAKLEGRSFDLSRVRMLSASRYPHDDQVIFQADQELGKIVAHRVWISTNSMRVSKQSCAFCIMREVWPKLTAIQYMDLCVAVSSCCQECRNRKCPLPNTLVLFRLELGDTGDFVISEGVGTSFLDNTTRTARGTLELTGCTSLVRLDLISCDSVDLGALSELQGLQTLANSECVAVRNSPTSLGELRNLKRLELFSVHEPFELPSPFENLPNLEHLSVESCKVTSVPSLLQFQNLKRLQVLRVDRVVSRQAMIIGFLQELQILNLKCWGIVNLVEGFRELTNLRELSLTCKGIEELPDTLGNLTNLEKLQLIRPIKCLPASFSNLTRLETLKLDGGFGTVESMDGSRFNLRFLEDSRVYGKVYGRFGEVDVVHKGIVVHVREDDIGCPISEFFHALQGFMRKQKSLILECQHGTSAVIVRNMIDLEVLMLKITGPEAVPDIFGDLQKLRILKLTCGAMENGLVESLGRLSSLETLDLLCRTVKRLPDVFHLADSTLKTLGIKCPSLQVLPDTFASSIQFTTVRIRGSGLCLPGSLDIKRLREFHLTGRNTPTTLPDTIWLMSHLESLLLCGLPKLRMLPEALGNLHSLQKLECRECAIKILPESLGPLTGLKELKIEDYVIRKTLPDTIGSLSNVGAIDLQELNNLTILPEALGNLHSLQKLRLWDCQIERLPEGLGRVTGLKRLDITYCRTLKTLPDTIGSLSNLESLVLQFLDKLMILPETLGNLHSLQKLEVWHCGIKSLPESLGWLSCLIHLNIANCDELKTLPDTVGGLSNLESLVLQHLDKLMTLPEALGNLHSLQKLELLHCGIESLPESLGWLSCLTHLKITDCDELKTLPDTIGGLSNLESLVLPYLDKLMTLPEAVGNLHSLQRLELVDCEIESLPGGLGRLTGLKHLLIKQCGNLKTLPDTIGGLFNLESLVLQHLGKLMTLPEALGNLHSLQKLEHCHCGIESLPESIGWLSCLTYLKITACDNLKTLPDTIGSLSNLESLVLEFLDKLMTLPEALGNLHSLHELELWHCGIESLPESLGWLSCLTHLKIKACEKMETLPDTIGGLSNLTSLTLVYCSNLHSRPESLGRLSCLTDLKLHRCRRLNTLPKSIGDLSSLRCLEIFDCGFDYFPSTIWDLSNLILLSIEQCKGLKLSLDTIVELFPRITIL
ncbi:hypothetical protein R1sor_025314 [Riccia sorocarpa]|uniref:NB-ARC domain-containing protein n=1 Tax=Riccia sorocarpa TaxID=122646 RepID=A0ABD3G9M4_9MARC